MSDIKLFRITGEHCSELEGKSAKLEKSLQTVIEQHLDALLGVRFLATEYITSKNHGGRMDTLGIDENGCPVIIEYKRTTDENVINQGLFYLDWLFDHRGTFELLVQKELGQEAADSIDWSAPRLLCIAGNFTKYDEHAVQQINRNIELIRYRHYGKELLLLELVNAVTATQRPSISCSDSLEPLTASPRGRQRTVQENLEAASRELTSVYESLSVYLTSLGDDVHIKTLKYYFAFRRLKNFACVEIRPQVATLVICIKLMPTQDNLIEGFTRDVTNIGHVAPGNLEITIKSEADLERAKPLLLQSYEAS